MENCNPMSTPYSQTENKYELTRATTSPGSKKYPCRNAIGSLMYAMVCSRPNLSYLCYEAIEHISSYARSGFLDADKTSIEILEIYEE